MLSIFFFQVQARYCKSELMWERSCDELKWTWISYRAINTTSYRPYNIYHHSLLCFPLNNISCVHLHTTDLHVAAWKQLPGHNWKCTAGNWKPTSIQPTYFLISALFWDITQRTVVILYRRFGTSYRSNLEGPRYPLSWALKMGPIGCSETSVRNYHC